MNSGDLAKNAIFMKGVKESLPQFLKAFIFGQAKKWIYYK